MIGCVEQEEKEERGREDEEQMKDHGFHGNCVYS